MGRMGRTAYLGIFGHLNVDWITDSTKDSPVRNGPFFGGVAGNIAVGAARFGVPVRLATVIGRNFPEGYMDLLETLNVDVRYIQCNKRVETSTCWMTTLANGNQKKEIFHGPQTGKVRFPTEFLTGLQHVHVSTGLPEACIRIAKQGAEAGLSVTFDPGADLARHYKRKDLLAALEFSNMLMVNEEELGVALELLGKASMEDLLDLVGKLVITIAGKGSILLTRTKKTEIPAVKVKRMVDPTGAGDAFRAGMYGGLFHGYRLTDSCLMGAIAASACVQCEGAQGGLMSWAELNKRFQALKAGMD